MDSVMVFHPDGNFSVCRTLSVSAPWWEGPHCGTCTCASSRNHPALEHGRYVTCGYCQKTGVAPDPGHEAEFLPASASVITNPDGTTTWRFSG